MSTDKQKLLDNLRNDVYCRLGVSNIQGVGVFAIKPIPADIDPFKAVDDSCYDERTVVLTAREVQALPTRVRTLIKDFFFKNPDTDTYGVYYKGPNKMDVSYYLNHSDDPNIRLEAVDGCPFYEFRTARKIKIGEELTFDYGGNNELGITTERS